MDVSTGLASPGITKTPGHKGLARVRRSPPASGMLGFFIRVFHRPWSGSPSIAGTRSVMFAATQNKNRNSVLSVCSTRARLLAARFHMIRADARSEPRARRVERNTRLLEDRYSRTAIPARAFGANVAQTLSHPAYLPHSSRSSILPAFILFTVPFHKKLRAVRNSHQNYHSMNYS
ncbi:hypothetical protein [Burkholderia singularis]|uniref:hypothetical protein n=1 Tax=Burkholderia singularis TaxID=1503053 RepID=UPI000A759A59|nr:hypothetical protein [Burkholderia singularis]